MRRLCLAALVCCLVMASACGRDSSREIAPPGLYTIREAEGASPSSLPLVSKGDVWLLDLSPDGSFVAGSVKAGTRAWTDEDEDLSRGTWSRGEGGLVLEYSTVSGVSVRKDGWGVAFEWADGEYRQPINGGLRLVPYRLTE